MNIGSLQDEAWSAYNRVPQSEAAGWAQVIVQCAIASQLERIADNLVKVYVTSDENPDLQNIAERISRIGSILLDKE